MPGTLKGVDIIFCWGSGRITGAAVLARRQTKT